MDLYRNLPFPRPPILVLFDIDGTLVDCGEVSARSFSQAFNEIFGVPCPIFPPDQVAGQTDVAILNRVMEILNVQCANLAQRKRLVFEAYARILAVEFETDPAHALPGVSRAIEAVSALPDCALGLLTGSTKATAKIKLKSAGIDFHQFRLGAFAEDGESREALPLAARTRFAQDFGQEPNVTILVGDTPTDVIAALATGCAFIGVTTGHYDLAALRKAGAQVVLNDLSNPKPLLEAIEAVSDYPKSQGACD